MSNMTRAMSLGPTSGTGLGRDRLVFSITDRCHFIGAETSISTISKISKESIAARWDYHI